MVAPPLQPVSISWENVLVGFALGVAGSGIGAYMQAAVSAFSQRRNHQFERMLRAADEIRTDIDSAISVASDYWKKAGGHPDVLALERELMSLQRKIVGQLALVRKLDNNRFSKLDIVCEEDFIDALTGGQFQVRGRASDPDADERVRRFGQRLSDRIAECSAFPSARHWVPWRS